MKASELLTIMTTRKPLITPNIRTINTILRGCVQTGEIELAENLFSSTLKDFKLICDVSSVEYLFYLLCQVYSNIYRFTPISL
jgi:pentatricopeptide repeat protein